MIGKKINQLATELAPASTDLTIIGNPTTGVSKKITLAQLGAIFSGAVSFYTNLASFPATGTLDVIFCAKDTQKLYLWSGSAYVEVFPSQALLDTYQLRSEKGNANGYASLDSSGKVPVSQLPSSIMEYKGTWSAATNTPTLANGTGDTGDVYICNAAGSVNFGAGAITFAVGDYVIYSGSIWQRSSGAVGTVTSVAASITGNAIGISGSPVTTSGTLALAFAGTSAQYVNGAGNLTTFPTIISQAQNLVTEVYNETGATLSKGTVVYINSGHGNLPTITKALATSDSTSAQTYGIVQADITNNNNGYVVVAGRLENIDTQAYTEGTQLYLSSTTAGAWTSTKQYAPAHLVYVGIVVRSHPTQGIVEVKIQNGYELDEIHDVSAQTPTNNDGLFWEASTSLWKNKSIATVLGYTPQAQLNGTGFVKASGTTITYDNSTYLTTSAAATTYLPMVLSSTAKSIELNGQTFDVSSVAGSYTSGRLIVTPNFTAIGYQSSGVFKGLQISTDGTANFYNTGLTRFFNQVQFDSTLTNGTYTYTLPGATGTLALTSDIPSLSGYVPYTGATTNLNLGSNNLTAAAITGSSARITTLAGSVYADVNGNLGTTAGTQNTIAYWGSQYSLASLSTTTYPDLTELSYVKGVTSSIQTQLNSKQSTLTNPVTGTGTTNYLPKFTGTSTIGNSQIFDNGSNIGLGTNSPSASYRITISGSTYQVGTNSKIYIDNGGVGGASAILGVVGTSYGYLNTDGGYPFVFQTNNTERMRLDASGNLGLGVTPSAWSGFTAFDIGSTGNLASYGSGADVQLNANAYFSGASWIYKTTTTAGRFRVAGNEFQWFTAPSGTAGSAISFTQAMTLDASGNLLLGATSQNGTSSKQYIRQSGDGGFKGLNIVSAATGQFVGSMSIDGSGNLNFAQSYLDGAGSFQGITFTTSGSTRLTIASTGAATFSGNVRIDKTTPLLVLNDTSGSGAQIGSFSNNLNLIDNATGTKGLVISLSTGAATFSSSVQATQGKFINSASNFPLTIDNTTQGYVAQEFKSNGVAFGYIGNANTLNSGGSVTDMVVRSENVLILSSASTERMRITSGGNVGIGTSNAYTRLRVDGDISAEYSSTIYLDYAPSPNTYKKGFSGVNQSTGSARGLHIFNYDADSNDGINFWLGTNSARTHAAIITNAGNVGIGTTSPSTILHLATTTESNIRIESGGAGGDQGSIYVQKSTGGGLTFAIENRDFIWRTGLAGLTGGGGSERMRITSGGNILFNTTSTSGAGGISFIKDGGGIYEEIYRNTTSTASHILFTNPNGTVGTIQTSGTSTSYNTSSDYRLKTDFKDFSGLDLVSKIKAYDYEWKSDKSRSYGVIAHELQSVINYAVTGVKDGEQMQGVDYSKIVPVLIKAIQELNDKIK